MNSKNWLKPCSPLITWLFIIAIVLHIPTKGYGSIICLVLAICVMAGQTFLQWQLKRDIAIIEHAQQQFHLDHKPAHLEKIELTTLRLLHENKLLTTDARQTLQQYYVSAQKQRSLLQ